MHKTRHVRVSLSTYAGRTDRYSHTSYTTRYQCFISTFPHRKRNRRSIIMNLSFSKRFITVADSIHCIAMQELCMLIVYRRHCAVNCGGVHCTSRSLMSSMRHLCSTLRFVSDSTIVSDVDFRNKLGIFAVMALFRCGYTAGRW